MKFGSVCSGIGAPELAWGLLGWEAQWVAEISPFPKAVLKHHLPTVPDLGDVNTIHTQGVFNDRSIELLVGGTPCQSFSLAGLRGGLDDPRGNLALVFLKIVDRARPRWVVWENVPGVLSSNGGWDFGSFLGALGQLGYGWGYRVLDAQYCGVPQRRRRVFVVGYIGDWRRPAAVLFERQSLSGYPAPHQEPGQATAPCIGSRPTGGGGLGTDAEVDGALIPETVGTLGANNKAAESATSQDAQNGMLVTQPPLAVAMRGREGGATGEVGGPVSFALRSAEGGGNKAHVLTSRVRRLTPRECERLQGFPDDYTLIPYRGHPAKDGPRYKALGNSMAVPVMGWIGKRIALVDRMKLPTAEVTGG